MAIQISGGNLLKVRVTYTGIAGVGRRQFKNECLNPMWEAGGKLWHTRFRPKHFTVRGGLEYRYKRRKRSYMIRKMRQKKHRKPLVWDGDLQKSAKTARFEPTRSGIRVVLPLARGANFKHPKSEIDMRQELTTVSSAEEDKIAKKCDQELTARMRRLSRSTTKTF